MSDNVQQGYLEVFLKDTPMIDLRAPCEFEQGAFPNAVNLPLMSDEERTQVGICYKEKGQQAAIKLGHELVSGSIKEQRIASWKAFANGLPKEGFIYCFRGGLRSRISQQWLADNGISLPIIQGGYKAMRRFLIDETIRISEQSNLLLLAGLTGSAKTKIIKQIDFAIDLEEIANHRGSSFGRHLTPQPSQINFENQLAIQMLKKSQPPQTTFLVEDEGRLIGSRSLPLVLKNKMEQAPLVFINETFDFRVEQIFEDYVVQLFSEFSSHYGNESLAQYHQFLNDSCQKIARRLGGDGLKNVISLIGKAISFQKEKHDLSKHRDWIVFLLKHYYDPMYNYQIERKQNRVIFSGDFQEVKQYLAEYPSGVLT